MYGNRKWGGIEYSLVTGTTYLPEAQRTYQDFDPVTGRALRSAMRQQVSRIDSFHVMSIADSHVPCEIIFRRLTSASRRGRFSPTSSPVRRAARFLLAPSRGPRATAASPTYHCSGMRTRAPLTSRPSSGSLTTTTPDQVSLLSFVDVSNADVNQKVIVAWFSHSTCEAADLLWHRVWLRVPAAWQLPFRQRSLPPEKVQVSCVY